MDLPIMALTAAKFDTPLGPMIAIGDNAMLYLLEFTERKGVEREIEQLEQKTESSIIFGCTAPIQSIEEELRQYFAGTLMEFKTKLSLFGSSFQKRVWAELQNIVYGSTYSYLWLAKAIGKPTACRAVAQANSCNQLAIVIPCHRVINHDGKLGGYAGGLKRKEWLLNHEKAHSSE